MSTLGKVLTFFNVIAAIILLIMAGMDYGAYRSARYAAFRHELVLTGLPVDDDEISPEYPDEPIAGKLSTGVLADVFKDAVGGADLGDPNPAKQVKTVLEELARVKDKCRKNVDSLGDDGQKRNKLRSYLLSQAKNIGEREELKAKIEKDPIPSLLDELDKYFDAVRKRYKPTMDTKNYEVVRFAAAEVLVNLSTDPAWWERVRVVLGFNPLVHGIDVAARVMNQIAADVREGMVRDQGNFRAAYDDQVRELFYQSENLYQANKRLTELRVVVRDRGVEVNQRRTEVDKNRTELAALTATTNAEVAKLEAIQRDLFALQQRLGQALESSRSLEEQLKKRAPNK